MSGSIPKRSIEILLESSQRRQSRAIVQIHKTVHTTLCKWSSTNIQWFGNTARSLLYDPLNKGEILPSNIGMETRVLWDSCRYLIYAVNVGATGDYIGYDNVVRISNVGFYTKDNGAIKLTLDITPDAARHDTNGWSVFL